jgi:guanine deaminase
VNILRAAIFHTPRNPFLESRALAAYPDGALVIEGGRVLACGEYAEMRAAYPVAEVRDLRGGYILPGFVDTHVHFPQVRIIGGLGYSLLDWLEQLTLPEEARLADVAYASAVASEFAGALAAHGTTTALVFGSHFVPATAALFEAAEKRGLRVFSGLVLSDRSVREELRQHPYAAYRDCLALIERFPRYAVTPRFALSASESILEVCGALMRERPNLLFTTHINENPREVHEVAKLFPWAGDYLSVYERFGLIGRNSVLAHNIHASDDELRRLAVVRATIAHCPASNAALGSGIFPLARHVRAGVRLALGTDIGGGTGFGMMKEALQCYLMQRVATDAEIVSPAQMLYLVSRAGAEALGIENETGDFAAGKAADLVYLRPADGSVLASVLQHAGDQSPERTIAALFTLAGADSIEEVQVSGHAVFHRAN